MNDLTPMYPPPSEGLHDPLESEPITLPKPVKKPIGNRLVDLISRLADNSIDARVQSGDLTPQEAWYKRGGRRTAEGQLAAAQRSQGLAGLLLPIAALATVGRGKGTDLTPIANWASQAAARTDQLARNVIDERTLRNKEQAEEDELARQEARRASYAQAAEEMMAGTPGEIGYGFTGNEIKKGSGGLPEEFAYMKPFLNATIKEDPEYAIKLLLQMMKPKTGAEAQRPLTEEEQAYLADRPVAEREYAADKPGDWRKMAGSQGYQSERFETGMGQRQYEQGVTESEAKYRRMNALADDWQANPTRKALAEAFRNYSVAKSAYQSILNDPKKAGVADQAIIMAFNKILDPTSVVREAEYNRTGEDLPLFNRWVSEFKRLTVGGRIDPASRKRAMDLMAEINDQMKKNYKEARVSAEARSRSQGIDPKSWMEEIPTSMRNVKGVLTDIPQFDSEAAARAAGYGAGDRVKLKGIGTVELE